MWQERWNSISYCEQLWKVDIKGVQVTAQCWKYSSQEIVWEIQLEKKWKIIWTCSVCRWKWRIEDFVGYYDHMWQRDQGKEIRYCCSE